MKQLLKIMKQFQEFSSLKINVEKCGACWLGKARHRTTQPARCKWTSPTKICIKILVITFSYNKALNFRDPIKSLQRKFIWSSNRTKIKHSTLIGDNREGGLKDTDVNAKFRSLKFMWIKRLKDSNFHPCNAVASCLLSPVGGDTIFHQNLLSDVFKQKVINYHNSTMISFRYGKKFQNVKV